MAITTRTTPSGAPPAGLAQARATAAREADNRRLLRARDAIDRSFAEPLDVAALAAVAHVSPSHFIRAFKAAFGETPHRYLQRRRIERAMALLRDTATPVTEVSVAVGFQSLGTFSRTFHDIVGSSPTSYRRTAAPLLAPGCFTRAWTRPAGAR
ncbi:helix-turn-helix domain-containing protein [Promicromonospora sp. NPDC050880]|uniref:helix-turn-helix domain-containing protein n=1 Tax=Promicromonospora sp. NPDC050880 TaxID=3364406 RepID=UPI0037AFC398